MDELFKSWIAQMRKGTVELCVLATLRHGEAYGYLILQRLGAVEGLAITESTIYPILARLTADGVLSVRSAPSEEGPPRRYYRLTPAGRLRLAHMSAYWKALESSVDSLLEAKGK